MPEQNLVCFSQLEEWISPLSKSHRKKLFSSQLFGQLHCLRPSSVFEETVCVFLCARMREKILDARVYTFFFILMCPECLVATKEGVFVLLCAKKKTKRTTIRVSLCDIEEVESTKECDI